MNLLEYIGFNTCGFRGFSRSDEWIAELCLNGMIEPSRIFPKEENSLLDGVELDEMIEGIPVSSIRKEADQIREAIRGRLETIQIILVRGGLEQIESIQRKIDELDKEIIAGYGHNEAKDGNRFICPQEVSP